MATTYDVIEFLEDVRRAGRLSDAASSSWSDDDIYGFANQEMQTAVVPLLLQVREEYLATTVDQTLTPGTSRYSIPTVAPRCIGNKLRLVQFAADGVTFQPLSRIEPEREHLLGLGSGSPQGFKVEGNDIVLLPTTANMSGKLRVTYLKRPDDIPTATEIPDAIPLEVVQYLVQRVVVRALEAEGDPKSQLAEKTADYMRASLITVLSPRIEGNPRPIINRNAPGWGRRFRRGR